MTATADILVAERENEFLVPMAALRFVPAPVNATSPLSEASFRRLVVEAPRTRAQPPRPPWRMRTSGFSATLSLSRSR